MGIHWKEARSTELKKMIRMPRMGLVTDMDGTISHIVEKPEDAVVSPRNHEILSQLREKLTLVSIVSGRSLQSVAERMGLKNIVYIGNHGLERCVNGKVKRSFDLKEYRPMLEAAVESLEKIDDKGVEVEDKEATVTLHYRQTEDPEAIQEKLLPIIEEVADKNDLDYFEGRMIFELRPPVSADKGTAFKRLVHDFFLDSVIYVGDDTTDIAALEMARELRERGDTFALGVAVTCKDCSPEVAAAADFVVSGVEDVENLFAWILENRDKYSPRDFGLEEVQNYIRRYFTE